MQGRNDCILLKRRLYDVCLNFYCETGLLVAGSAIFVGDGCTRTDTIGTDAVYETNSGSGTGWGVTNVGCGVNSVEI